MLKKLLYFLVGLMMTVSAVSCRDEEVLNEGTSANREEGRPVQITASLPNPPATRAFEDVKMYFEKNELIHIIAEYDCEINGKEFTVKQYGVMKYSGRGVWEPFNEGTALSWPGAARKGSFKAYYISGSNSVLSGNTMEPKLLKDYTYADDPLEAEVVNLPYGHTIGFNFTHLFAHLTLYDLQDGISDRFWLTRQDNGEENKLNNAFHIEYDAENKEIKPVFSAIPDEQYGGLVYLTSNVDYEYREDEEVARVNYFVEPGNYDSFQVRYPRTSTQVATYLTYKKTAAGNTLLEGNGRYEFSVLRSLGIIIVEKPGSGWDEDGEPFAIADVERFLKAANAGVDYYEPDPETGEPVQILLATQSGTELLRNVDFRNEYYDVFGAHDGEEAFIPNLSKTFDGGYHYIYNLGCALFNDNTGIIKNVGIKGADTSAHPLESNENYPVANLGSQDFSRQGIIARLNHGTVNNVRVSDVNMTVLIRTSDPELPDQEAHNASLLFGTNLGYIYDIYFSGNNKLVIENYPGETVIPTVTVGGITAQNQNYISGIQPLGSNTLSITIENRCSGSAGVYIIGGIAGNSTGSVYDIMIPNLEIDGSESRGQHSYMGGLIGSLSESTGSPATISSCLVKGSLKAGTSSSSMGIVSNSYTGGIAGYVNIQCVVMNCSASCSVAGPVTAGQNTLFGTGGAFGRITKTLGVNEGSIQTVAAYGETLTGAGFKGCFAGILPSGMTWNDYSSRQINVKKINGIEYVGTSL